MNYLLARNGQQHGPYALEDLQRMVAQGTAFATDLVWREGMPSWAPLLSVLPSVPQSRPAPLPMPPPPPMAGFPQSMPANPAYGFPQVAVASPYPLVPPSLHWGLVLLFTMITFGIFYWVWCFKQSNFVRKIDPTDSSRVLMIIAIVGVFGSGVLSGVAAAEGGSGGAAGIASLVQLVGVICIYVAVFKMRGSMENYYNTVEPIGLRLSGAMTFFFGILYLQYHFTRIATWKQTGAIQPQ